MDSPFFSPGMFRSNSAFLSVRKSWRNLTLSLLLKWSDNLLKIVSSTSILRTFLRPVGSGFSRSTRINRLPGSTPTTARSVRSLFQPILSIANHDRIRRRSLATAALGAFSGSSRVTVTPCFWLTACNSPPTSCSMIPLKCPRASSMCVIAT